MTHEAAIAAIRTALVNAGEFECRVLRTRSTGRLHYAPEADGFRIYAVADGLRSMPTPFGMRRIGVGHVRHLRGVLNRYAAALRAAGIEVVIDATWLRPTCVRVWLVEPVEAGERT